MRESFPGGSAPSEKEKNHAESERRRGLRILRSNGEVDGGWEIADIESERKENSKTLVTKTARERMPDGKMREIRLTKTVPTIELYAMNPDIRGIVRFPITEWMKLWNVEEPDPLLKIRGRDLTTKELGEMLAPDEAKARLRELAGRVKERHENEKHPIIPIDEYIKNLEKRERLFGLSSGERYELVALREAIKKPAEQKPEELREAA